MGDEMQVLGVDQVSTTLSIIIVKVVQVETP